MNEAKEKEYQAYIDELHKENIKLKNIIADTENRLCKTLDELDLYRKAVFNAFVKWGQTDAH